jgi:O-antigen ligase
VTAIAGRSTAAHLIGLVRDPSAWTTAVDVFVVLLAVALPFSTSLVAIFAVAMLVAIAPCLDVEAFLRTLKQPIAAAPVALFALAVVGALWSDAPWSVRLYAILPTVKLLALPFLFYHFERSERGEAVFVAFLVSCAALAVMSWIVMFDPALTLKSGAEAVRGIFVKNYIDQSQEFTLCAVALAYPMVMFARNGRIWLALLCSTIAAAFILTMTFVIVSRTALVTMPIMLAVFGLMHLRARTNLAILSGTVAVAAVAWAVSPQLEHTVSSFRRDYQLYEENGTSTSIGERLEYWRKSLRFFVEAPVVGHGTGSTRGLFEQAARGPAVLAAAKVINNPHNQMLNVAVQWGAVGVAALVAMWLLHFLLFRGGGFANWIGLLVVVQNIFTSLFNSHIFDFHEGWMYVLGVGVAGGMALKSRMNEPEVER